MPKVAEKESRKDTSVIEKGEKNTMIPPATSREVKLSASSSRILETVRRLSMMPARTIEGAKPHRVI